MFQLPPCSTTPDILFQPHTRVTSPTAWSQPRNRVRATVPQQGHKFQAGSQTHNSVRATSPQHGHKPNSRTHAPHQGKGYSRFTFPQQGQCNSPPQGHNPTTWSHLHSKVTATQQGHKPHFRIRVTEGSPSPQQGHKLHSRVTAPQQGQE